MDGFRAGIRDAFMGGFGDGVGIGDDIRGGLRFFPGSLITIWRCPGRADTLPGPTSSREQTIPVNSVISFIFDFIVCFGVPI